MRQAGAIALLLAFACSAAPEPQTGGMVEGRVTSTVHGEAVRKAVVTLRGLTGAGGAPVETYLCETDSSGRFSIAGVAPGKYEARASKQGYETLAAQRFAARDEFPQIIVTAGQRIADIDLHLVPEGVLSGHVFTGDGDPLRRVMIQTMQYRYVAGNRQLTPLQGAQTDDRGEFRLFNVPPGRYYLRAMASLNMAMANLPRVIAFTNPGRPQRPAENYVPTFYPNATDAGQATPIVLAPGGEISGIDFRMSPHSTYSIRGKLLGTAPSQGGWSVMAHRRGDGPSSRGARLNNNNADYEVDGLTPGSYVVTGQMFGPGRELRMYARQLVEVTSGDVEGIDLNFTPGVTVSGTVTVEGTAEIELEDAQVMLQPDEGNAGPNLRGDMDSDGAFEIKGVIPDVYQLRVGVGDAYIKSVKTGGREIADQRIDVARLSGPVSIVVSGDMGTVTGSVTDADGKPAYNANVTLIPAPGVPGGEQRFKNVVTNVEGAFTFSKIVPGDYKLFAWDGVERGAPQSAEFRKAYEDRGVAIKVAANGRARAKLKVIQPAQDGN